MKIRVQKSMLSTGCRGLQSALEAIPDLLTAEVF